MGRSLVSTYVLGIALLGHLLAGESLAQLPALVSPEGPALEAPSDSTPTQITNSPSPAPPADRGPILAVPGIPKPRVTSSVKTPATPPALGDLPALTPPADFEPRPLPRNLTSRPAGGDVLNLEPDTGENSLPKTPKRPIPPPNPEPARRPTMFGRMFGGQPAPGRASTGSGADPDDEIELESPSDPAKMAALRRRIERQASDAVGDRARQVEVRIKGKDVHIRVTGAKLFQKRSIRSALEKLPTSNGYRTIIDAIE